MLKNGKIYTERQESSLEALAWSLGTSMQRLENYKVSPRYLQRFSLFSSDNEVILRVIAQQQISHERRQNRKNGNNCKKNEKDSMIIISLVVEEHDVAS